MIHRSGGFDALRLVAASMVIFGHSYPLTGHVASFGLLANGVHAIGVKIFFVISGYLITRSWQSDPHLGRFWLKRALRIDAGLAHHLPVDGPGRGSCAKPPSCIRLFQ